MVDVAQLVERRVVAAVVESSSLSVHPKGYRIAAIALVSKTGERKLHVGSSPTAGVIRHPVLSFGLGRFLFRYCKAHKRD